MLFKALDNSVVAEPYSAPDYDYTIHDGCDHENGECVLDDPNFEEHWYGPQPVTVIVPLGKALYPQGALQVLTHAPQVDASGEPLLEDCPCGGMHVAGTVHLCPLNRAESLASDFEQ